jgi:hypothetical protein
MNRRFVVLVLGLSIVFGAMAGVVLGLVERRERDRVPPIVLVPDERVRQPEDRDGRRESGGGSGPRSEAGSTGAGGPTAPPPAPPSTGRSEEDDGGGGGDNEDGGSEGGET